jgi:hypothetical protein
MRGRGIAAAAIAVAALVGAGCGGDDDTSGGGETLTKQEWIAKADAICADAQGRIQKLGDPGADLGKLAELTGDAKQIIEDEIAAIRDLRPPSGEEQQIDALLAQVEKGSQAFEALIEAASSGDIAKLQEITAEGSEFSKASAEADRLAAEYGLKECGSR